MKIKDRNTTAIERERRIKKEGEQNAENENNQEIDFRELDPKTEGRETERERVCVCVTIWLNLLRWLARQPLLLREPYPHRCASLAQREQKKRRAKHEQR